MTFGTTSVWTPEATAHFERMHAANFSYGNIAHELQKLGYDIGRNACIGKARRMKITNKRLPGTNQGDRRITTSAPPKPKTKIPFCRKCGKQLSGMVPFDAKDIICFGCDNPKPSIKNRTGLLQDLDRDQCRWPVTSGDPPFMFCTEDKIDNSSYCAAHHARAVQPVRSQR